MNKFIWLGLCMGFLILSGIFLGMWTYRDAKNKGLNAALWTVIVMLGPNGIGLLVYLLVARKQQLVKCKSCNSNISNSSKYCMNCGNLVTEVKEIDKKSTKHLMIGFITTLIIAFISFMVLGFNLINDSELEFKSGTSLFLFETNLSNKWNVSYYKSTSKFDRNITKKDNKPSTLYVEGKCETGNLGLKLRQGEKEEVIDIKNTNGVKEIDLGNFDNGEIKLSLVNEDCVDVEFKANWE